MFHPLLTLFLYLVLPTLFHVIRSRPCLPQTTWESILTYKLPTTNKRPCTLRRSVWCYSLGDFDKACAILYDVHWDTVTNESDIDLCWSNWQRTYLSIISQCVTQKLLPRKKHLPWISLSILKKRNSLLNKYKRSGNQAILSLYKLTRN